MPSLEEKINETGTTPQALSMTNRRGGEAMSQSLAGQPMMNGKISDEQVTSGIDNFIAKDAQNPDRKPASAETQERMKKSALEVKALAESLQRSGGKPSPLMMIKCVKVGVKALLAYRA